MWLCDATLISIAEGCLCPVVFLDGSSRDMKNPTKDRVAVQSQVLLSGTKCNKWSTDAVGVLPFNTRHTEELRSRARVRVESRRMVRTEWWHSRNVTLL